MNKDCYIDIAKNNPDKHKKYPGYVYIGKGIPEGHNWFFETPNIYIDRGGGLDNDCYTGVCQISDYYVPESHWEEKVRQSFEETMKPEKADVVIEGKTYEIDLTQAKKLGIIQEKREPQIGDIYEDSDGNQLMLCYATGHHWLFYTNGKRKGHCYNFAVSIKDLRLNQMKLINP